MALPSRLTDNSLSSEPAPAGVVTAASLTSEPSSPEASLQGPARSVYLPALALLVVAGGLVAVGWSTGWGGTGFGAELTNVRVVDVGPLSLIFLGVFLIVERLRPAQKRPLLARGYRQDLIYTILNATLVLPLAVALSLSFGEVARKAVPWIVLPHVPFVPHWLVDTILFVLIDGCNWLTHLANHRIQVLWRFHELHHSQEDMSVRTVFRTHPLIHVSYLIALLPGIVLIESGEVSTALLVAYGAFVAFEHSNTNISFGPLDRIFVSPNYHRIHHRLNGSQDVNVGFALTIWDQLAHCAVFPTAETIRCETGLPGRPLLVEQEGDHPHYMRVLIAQLIGPFRPISSGTDSTG